MRGRWWALLLILLISGLISTTAAGAATLASQRPVPLPTRPGPADPHEVAAFVDAFLTTQMSERHIPGAVFVLVKDGQILLAKGYGYADLAQHTPVVPETTVFRVQSISKLFTATAIMQLHERGKLDLDADVNTYLKHFQLASTFPGPVTTAQLLTHTGGFDQQAIGVSAPRADEQQPLGEYLAQHMPARIRPPGTLYDYNNHGMALAGYLVEEISGVPFAEYIDEHILRPLEMRHSSFVRSPEIASHMAVEYVYRSGVYQAVPFDYLNTLPAGGLNATGVDMAHFMIAQLQRGRYLNQRILSEASAQEMQQQHFTAHPQLPGMAYGFHEYFQNGLRALEHGGTWAGSTSELMLFPAHNMGFFLSYTRNDEGPRDRFTRHFIDHYFSQPQGGAPTMPAPATSARAAQFVGSYRSISFTRSDLFKLGAWLNEYQITAEADGTLVLHYPSAHAPSRWAEVQPLVFERIAPADDTESAKAAFQEDQTGAITYLFIGTGTTLTRLAWYETTTAQGVLMAGMLLTFLSGCLVWACGGLWRRLRRQSQSASTHSRWPYWIAGLYSGLALVLLFGLAVSLVTIDPNAFNVGIPVPVQLLLIIPRLLLACTPGLLLCAGWVWRRGGWSLLTRLHYALMTLAALLFIPFLHYWNLLGWQW